MIVRDSLGSSGSGCHGSIARARPEPAQERRLALGEERRVVRRPNGGVRAAQRAVARRDKGAAPGLERPEEPRVPQADVERAVAAGRQACERPLRRRPRDRQVGVGPREDVVHEEPFPRAGPLAVEPPRHARGRHHGDERRDDVLRDQLVGEPCEPQPVRERVRAAGHALEEEDDAVAAGRRDVRREVDEHGPARAGHEAVRDRPAPHRPAGRPLLDLDPRRRKREHLQRVAPAS